MDNEEYHKRITAYIKGIDDDEDKAKLEDFNKLTTYINGGYE